MDASKSLSGYLRIRLIKQTKLVMQIPFALVIVERSGFSEVTVMLYDASRTYSSDEYIFLIPFREMELTFGLHWILV